MREQWTGKLQDIPNLSETLNDFVLKKATRRLTHKRIEDIVSSALHSERQSIIEEIKQLLDDEGYVGKDDIIWHELPIISEMNKNLAEKATDFEGNIL